MCEQGYMKTTSDHCVFFRKFSCHAPNPGPTRLADPNRVRGARLRIGTLYLIFFFKSQLAPVGMAHIL